MAGGKDQNDPSTSLIPFTPPTFSSPPVLIQRVLLTKLTLIALLYLAGLILLH